MLGYTVPKKLPRLLWYSRGTKGHALAPLAENPLKTCLESGYFREVEAANFHRGHHHVKGFLPTGAHGLAHGFHAVQHLNQTLVEAEISEPVFYLAVLHQERAIAGHAGKNFFIRVYFADVPQSRDQDTSLRSGDHLLDSLLAPGRDKNDVGRRFAHLVGQREAVPGDPDYTHFVFVL